MNTCESCKYWSELIAQSLGYDPVEAVCLNEASSQHSDYTRGNHTCPQHEAGDSIDDPAGQWADDDLYNDLHYGKD